MAKDAVDEAVHGLERSLDRRVPPSVHRATSRCSAPRATRALWNQRHLLAAAHGLHVARIEHLLEPVRLADRRGARAGRATTRRWASRWPGADDYLRAEVVYAATHEGARHLDDVLTRRTRISIETFDRGTGRRAGGRRADGRRAGLERRAARARGRALPGAGRGRAARARRCPTTRPPTPPGSGRPTSSRWPDRGAARGMIRDPSRCWHVRDESIRPEHEGDRTRLATPARSRCRCGSSCAPSPGSAGVLVAAIVAALVWANVDAGSLRGGLAHRAVDPARRHGHRPRDLRTWVNSGLMTLFFLVVGLEARREFDLGDLRDRSRFVLPLLAGVAGDAGPGR